jgi:hypothetical protein
MSKEISSKTIWNEASRAGVALGLLCIACMVLSTLLAKVKGGVALNMAVSVGAFVIWAVKFTGCIALMKKAMERFVSAYPGADNRDSYRLGVTTALLSALIVAAGSLANYMFLAPAETAAAIDVVMQQYSTSLDSNTMKSLEAVMDNFPTISFFSNLIYCFIYGWILSAILSRRIPSSNPFSNPNA